MRSNMASTCGSASRPAVLIERVLLEARQEVYELVELLGTLLLQGREGRHWRSRIHERPCDRLAAQARADRCQRRPRAGVAVLADLVAGQAARGGGDLLAALVLWRNLQGDLGR